MNSPFVFDEIPVVAGELRFEETATGWFPPFLAERQSSERWPLHSDPDPMKARRWTNTEWDIKKEGTGMYPETEIRYDWMVFDGI